MKEDIRVPEYCCLSKDYDNSCDPDINAWFGPANTVSPLHYDPKDNLLAQVRQRILLYRTYLRDITFLDFWLKTGFTIFPI